MAKVRCQHQALHHIDWTGAQEGKSSDAADNVVVQSTVSNP